MEILQLHLGDQDIDELPDPVIEGDGTAWACGSSLLQPAMLLAWTSDVGTFLARTSWLTEHAGLYGRPTLFNTINLYDVSGTVDTVDESARVGPMADPGCHLPRRRCD